MRFDVAEAGMSEGIRFRRVIIGESVERRGEQPSVMDRQMRRKGMPVNQNDHLSEKFKGWKTYEWTSFSRTSLRSIFRCQGVRPAGPSKALLAKHVQARRAVYFPRLEQALRN